MQHFRRVFAIAMADKRLRGARMKLRRSTARIALTSGRKGTGLWTVMRRRSMVTLSLFLVGKPSAGGEYYMPFTRLNF
jgi:hypothetical protein